MVARGTSFPSSSTTRTSNPGMAFPALPGLVSRGGWSRILVLRSLPAWGTSEMPRQRRARLGRPPVVDDQRTVCGVPIQQALVHGDDGGLGALARQEQGLEAPQAPALADLREELVIWVVLADSSEGRGGRAVPFYCQPPSQDGLDRSGDHLVGEPEPGLISSQQANHLVKRLNGEG